MPEGIYPITEATLYLATAPKSNSAKSIYAAQDLIQKEGMGAVPVHLMDSSRDAAGFGHGEGYLYPHNYPGHFIPQEYLPKSVLGNRFYEPSGEGYEQIIARRLEQWHRQIEESSQSSDVKKDT
jgi:putative ATPase